VPLVTVAKASSTGSPSFAEAVREAIRVGGCNVSRAGVIGAVYGALLGGSDETVGVPSGWTALVRDGEALLDMAQRLVLLRPHHP